MQGIAMITAKASLLLGAAFERRSVMGTVRTVLTTRVPNRGQKRRMLLRDARVS